METELSELIKINKKLLVIIQMLMLSISSNVMVNVPPDLSKGIMEDLNKLYLKLFDQNL